MQEVEKTWHCLLVVWWCIFWRTLALSACWGLGLYVVKSAAHDPHLSPGLAAIVTSMIGVLPVTSFYGVKSALRKTYNSGFHIVLARGSPPDKAAALLAQFPGPVTLTLGRDTSRFFTLGRDIPLWKLDTEGIEFIGWRGYRVRWQDAEFCSLLSLAILVDRSPPHGRWDRFQRAYLGGNYRVLMTPLGLSGKNLVRLLNAWRERALGGT